MGNHAVKTYSENALSANRFDVHSAIVLLCYYHCDNSGRFVVRAFSNASVLFLIFISGCFGGRSGMNDDVDGGPSSKSESGMSDSGDSSHLNMDGSVASSDVRRFPNCGNGIVDMGEACDGFDLAGATCSSLMPGRIGTLTCRADCSSYDTTMCYYHNGGPPGTCGNNIVETNEICDGTDLAGATCDTLAAGNIGTLICAPDCLNFDTTMCYLPPTPRTCGNNIKEIGEICDGTDLARTTCNTLATGNIGTLRCSADCLNFDTSACYRPVDDDDAGVDDGRTAVSGQCVRSTGAYCESDRDCVQGGCGNELCYNPDYGAIATTCDCTAPTGIRCGCVNGGCNWWTADR